MKGPDRSGPFLLWYNMYMNSKFVYGLIDPITGQLRYVGRTIIGIKRIKAHLYDKTHGGNIHKKNWIKNIKDCRMDLNYEILEYCENDFQLIESEQFWISYFKMIGCNLLNVTAGGDGIYRPSIEVRQKMSVWQKGMKKPDDYYSKPPHRFKKGHSAWNKGIKYTGRYLESHAKARAIPPFKDENGNIYNRIKDASNALGIPKSNICKVLKGQRKSAGGHTFKYLHEN